MSNSVFRVVSEGTTFLSPTDFYVKIDTLAGAVQIVLPNSASIFQNLNDSNTVYNYIGIRFFDSSNNASVNNITLTGSDADLINGQSNVVLNTNGIGGTLTLIGEGQWSFQQNSISSGGSGGGVIQEDTGVLSSVRIDSGNSASGDYSTALGGSNSVQSFGSSVNGFNNNIKVSSCSAYPIPQAIVGGCSNTIENTCSSYYGGGNIIVGGVRNVIDAGDNALNFIGNGRTNTISSCFSFIGAGSDNRVLDASNCSFIGGGRSNEIVSCSSYSSVLGGNSNSINSSSNFSVIAGGSSNGINSSRNSLIGVGNKNNITQSAFYSVIVGGQNNNICNPNNYFKNDNGGFILGGNGNALVNPNGDAIVGGQSNCSSSCCNTSSSYYISFQPSFSFIGGGTSNQITNCISDTASCYSTACGRNTISGGYRNQAGQTISSYQYSGFATVGGGSCNLSLGAVSTISGGGCNTASSDYTTIGGGYFNSASNYRAGVFSGTQNNASGCSSIIGGGTNNITSGDFSSILGGLQNSTASAYSTISGGYCNTISGYGCNSAIAGGIANTISNYSSFIGGGTGNSVSGYLSAIIGGRNNTVSNSYSTASGYTNTISGYNSNAFGTANNLSGSHNTALGSNNGDNGFGNVHLIGVGNSANRDCSTFVNKLTVSQLDTCSALPPTGGLYYDTTTCVVYYVP